MGSSRGRLVLWGGVAYLILTLAVVTFLGTERVVGEPHYLGNAISPVRVWFNERNELLTVFFDEEKRELGITIRNLPDVRPRKRFVPLPMRDGKPPPYAISTDGMTVAWTDDGSLFVKEMGGGNEEVPPARFPLEDASPVLHLTLVQDRTRDQLVAVVVHSGGRLIFYDYIDRENLGGTTLLEPWPILCQTSAHLVLGTVEERGDVVVFSLDDVNTLRSTFFTWVFRDVSTFCATANGTGVMGQQEGEVLQRRGPHDWERIPAVQFDTVTVLAPTSGGGLFVGGEIDGTRGRISRIDSELIQQHHIKDLRSPVRLLTANHAYIAFATDEETGYIELEADLVLRNWVKEPLSWLGFVLGLIGTIATLLALVWMRHTPSGGHDVDDTDKKSAGATGGSSESDEADLAGIQVADPNAELPRPSSENSDRSEDSESEALIQPAIADGDPSGSMDSGGSVETETQAFDDESYIEPVTLAPGASLGRYEIRRRIGGGGMAEVYQAFDPKLERVVAIKVIRRELTTSSTAAARFARETKAVASLDHRNIVKIFDVHEVKGITYAVMEFLNGETLATLMTRGTLSVAEAIEISRQIAVGLYAAHLKNIVHRDVKPDNVFLTADGVKIIDFGLAVRKPGSDDEPEAGTPGTPPLTKKGTFVGTMGYSSPEQIRGQPTDARTDVFSFGCVVYEMLSGHRPFFRGTSADTTVAILKEPPTDISSFRADLPRQLRGIVERCLQKDASDRFSSMREVIVMLDGVDPDDTSVPGPSSGGDADSDS